MRIQTKEIRKIVATYTITTDDEEMEPVVAGLELIFTKELMASKKLILDMVDTMSQAFKDLFEEEVE